MIAFYFSRRAALFPFLRFKKCPSGQVRAKCHQDCLQGARHFRSTYLQSYACNLCCDSKEDLQLSVAQLWWHARVLPHGRSHHGCDHLQSVIHQKRQRLTFWRVWTLLHGQATAVVNNRKQQWNLDFTNLIILTLTSSLFKLFLLHCIKVIKRIEYLTD